MTTAADMIRAALDESPYSWHGLRVVDDAAEAVVGVVLGASRVWVDGDPTDEMLPGTSALTLRHGVAAALRMSRPYPGRYLLVIGADRNADDAGDVVDDGETLLCDPVVLAAIKRE